MVSLALLIIPPALAAEKWYHGLLPREDINTLLRRNGEFLVRMTEPNAGEQRTLVLSVMHNEQLQYEGVKHLLINWTPEDRCYVERLSFETVPDLVNHYMKTKESLMTSLDVILKCPIPRQHWELEHEQIDCTHKLGEGAFGEVFRGVIRQSERSKESRETVEVEVAIKQAKLEVLTKVQIKDFMREARTMRYLDHPNVVKFYGVAAGQTPLMVVMELANCGALDRYLQATSQSMEVKMEMCLQAAWGFEYLHSRPILHRDIAARNCLYSNGQVKISDFGLSREGTFYQMNPKNRVPIKWLAPETMRTAIYTQKTDVFSFGILIWEIFFNGAEPYTKMTPQEVFMKVREEKYRLPLPPPFNPEIRKIVQDHCWNENPNERYSMMDVANHMMRHLGVSRPNFEIAAQATREMRERREHEERLALKEKMEREEESRDKEKEEREIVKEKERREKRRSASFSDEDLDKRRKRLMEEEKNGVKPEKKEKEKKDKDKKKKRKTKSSRRSHA